MKILGLILIISFALTACDNVTVEGPEVKVQYHFSSQSEFIELYIPLQNEHGGIKSWVPSEDMDCPGGKVFTLSDGTKATFCPANGDESLFK